MTLIIKGKDITLNQLLENFGLERTYDPEFFPEWQEDLPELETAEIARLDEVQEDYRHLSRYTLTEPLIKMVVLAPLLRLAGFFRHPFYVTGEDHLELFSDDEEMLIRGQLDILVFQPGVWVLSVESKMIAYSLEMGIPQALFYMLAKPNDQQPAFGFVTNGVTFQFLKLVKGKEPKYARSALFALENEHDLYEVLKILKRLGLLMVANFDNNNG